MYRYLLYLFTTCIDIYFISSFIVIFQFLKLFMILLQSCIAHFVDWHERYKRNQHHVYAAKMHVMLIIMMLLIHCVCLNFFRRHKCVLVTSSFGVGRRRQKRNNSQRIAILSSSSMSKDRSPDSPMPKVCENFCLKTKITKSFAVVVDLVSVNKIPVLSL